MDDFCSQYADAVCQIATCGPLPATCTAYQKSVCETLASQATAGGKRMFTPNNMGDCLSKLNSAYKRQQPITPAMQASIDLACDYVFQGKSAVIPTTDTCTTQFDCAGVDQRIDHLRPAHHLCAPRCQDHRARSAT